ncbi:serine/threonine protein kinase [Minicystis rosea]|nr:serine/threonine protein kinase [Minicystis rosea]
MLAEHIGLGKLVVAKILHEDMAKDPELGRRMQIEARSVAALTSPHIVQVTDLGQTATGRTFIVMERLVGRTLGAEVKARGALPFLEAIEYVVQVCDGLEAAHAIGIVHRDIKPDNIFLCDATKDTPRTVKVLDFGIAKVLEVGADVGRPLLPQLVTATGRTLGTPRMFAPEQATGGPIDARTDVYSTGLVLYTLLTGTRPYAHVTDEVDLIMACVSEPLGAPSTKTENPIPPALDAAVKRAVAKRPAERFQSAAHFSTELRRIAAEAAFGANVATVPASVPRSNGGSESEEIGDRTLQLVAAGNPTTDVVREPPALGMTPEQQARADGDPFAVRAQGASWGAFIGLTVLGAVLAVLALLVTHQGGP